MLAFRKSYYNINFRILPVIVIKLLSLEFTFKNKILVKNTLKNRAFDEKKYQSFYNSV